MAGSGLEEKLKILNKISQPIRILQKKSVIILVSWNINFPSSPLSAIINDRYLKKSALAGT